MARRGLGCIRATILTSSPTRIPNTQLKAHVLRVVLSGGRERILHMAGPSSGIGRCWALNQTTAASCVRDPQAKLRHRAIHCPTRGIQGIERRDLILLRQGDPPAIAAVKFAASRH